MNPLLKRLLQRVMAPETGGEGSGGGGKLDDLDLGSGDIDYDDVSGDRGDTPADDEEESDEEESEESKDDEEEPEDEDEESKDGEEEPEDKPKAKGKKDNRVIPRERLNQEIAKRKEERARLEAENTRLREQLARDETVKKLSGIESEIGTLEESYSKLSAEGQVDKAADVLKQIRMKERELLRLESSAMTDRARSAAKEEIRVETLVETLTEQYPVIDPAAEEYDQDVVDMIEGLRSRYMQAGHAPSAALKAAATKVLGRMAAKDDEPAPKKGLAGAPKAAEKTAAAVKKAVDASKRQPAKAEVGIDHDKRGAAYSAEKIAKMSEAEYDKLPEHVKAKARGDFA